MFTKKQELIEAYLQSVGECLLMFDPSVDGVFIPDQILQKRLMKRDWGFSLPVKRGITTCDENTLSATFSEGTFVIPYSAIFLIECKPMGDSFEFKESIPAGYHRMLSILKPFLKEKEEKPENELSFKKEAKKLKKS